MKEPEGLNFNVDAFLSYLKNECRDYLLTKKLLGDSEENMDLDDKVVTEKIFFHKQHDGYITSMLDRLKEKCRASIECQEHDENTGCLVITGRVLEIENAKYILKHEFPEACQ